MKGASMTNNTFSSSINLTAKIKCQTPPYTIPRQLKTNDILECMRATNYIGHV